MIIRPVLSSLFLICLLACASISSTNDFQKKFNQVKALAKIRSDSMKNTDTAEKLDSKCELKCKLNQSNSDCSCKKQVQEPEKSRKEQILKNFSHKLKMQPKPKLDCEFLCLLGHGGSMCYCNHAAFVGK